MASRAVYPLAVGMRCCDQCRHGYILAFSCKARYVCPSCHQKRVLAYDEWVEANVLTPVPHRQYVFTVPRLLRPLFARRRRLAQNMLRAPFSLEKISYEPVSGTVIYRSRMHKTPIVAKLRAFARPGRA